MRDPGVYFANLEFAPQFLVDPVLRECCDTRLELTSELGTGSLRLFGKQLDSLLQQSRAHFNESLLLFLFLSVLSESQHGHVKMSLQPLPGGLLYLPELVVIDVVQFPLVEVFVNFDLDRRWKR